MRGRASGSMWWMGAGVSKGLRMKGELYEVKENVLGA